MPGPVPAGVSSRVMEPVTEPVTRGVTYGYAGGRGIYGLISMPLPDAQPTDIPGFGTESEARKRVSIACRTLTVLFSVFSGVNQRVLTIRTGPYPGPGIRK